jgi:putative membrane protein insertion efficiency factor
MSKTIHKRRERSPPLGGRIAKALLLAPIAAYRFAISPLLGVNCRHLPTCSDYAREAIETNGAWKGFWLTLSRLCRCQPWGSDGYDPVPDLSNESHPFAPWRYGRWRLNPRDAATDSG